MQFLFRLLVWAPVAIALPPPLLAETIELAPGHQEVLSTPGIRRAAIGDPEVADVQALPESQQVIVTAHQAGSTDLILWLEGGKQRSYAITVRKNPEQTEGNLKQLLDGIEGIAVERRGRRLAVTGEIYRAEDWQRLHDVLEHSPKILDLTRVNAQALDYFASQATLRLEGAGFAQARARAGGDVLLLEGEVPKKRDLARAERVVRGIYPNLQNDLVVAIAQAPLLLVDVKMMEVRSSSLGDVGLSWLSAVSATGAYSFPGGGSLTVGEGATLSLQALVEKGAARILANPKLLCRDGDPATFIAGGEIPIRLVGERTASVTFKPYGIHLGITARVDRARSVLLEIESKISDLDPATAIDGIPGILEHSVKTAANLRIGDTVVLGGLIENRARKNIRKVPLLGHVPILGELFKSRSFQNSESEFLVFLTPLPAQSGSYTHQRSAQEIQTRLREIGRDLHLSILD